MENKHILLGVSGGIAAFKAAALTSKLTQKGFQVRVIMTDSAQEFVTPLTFQALSRHPVYTDTFAEKDPSKIAHIDLADWADLILLAPATANLIGKLANGIADNMLTTTILASTAQVWFAPAMNINMLEHPSVKSNIETLKSYGYHLIEPNEGQLACGWVGKGRMEEPELIIDQVENYFNKQKEQPLRGKTIVITAGPTQERVDPIRFFTNRSSGKMGYEIAEAAKELGANVILISGKTYLTPPNVNLISVETAEEMYEAVSQYFDQADVLIKAAAVADYRPKLKYEQKMKKTDGNWHIEMERTIDILKTMGERKKHQILVGFAAETEKVKEHAERKLHSKNCDMIIANNVASTGAGFAGDTNIVTIFKKDGTSLELPLLSKREVAQNILMQVNEMLKDRDK